MGILSGKVVVITGAARKRGIGRATALRLAQDGADVVVSAGVLDPARFPENESAQGWLGVTSLAEEIRALGRQALAIGCDVTDPGQVQAMFSRTAAELGRVDIVINNAGTAGGSGSATIVDMEDSLWHRTIDVNLNGSYHVSKAAARAMIGAGHGGIIINISSVAGRVGLADSGAYCASKFAIIGLTQQMALELAKYQIRVNCICPGSVDTDMLEGTFRRTAERMGLGYEKVVSAVDRKIPLGRQGAPEEQAAAIAFLVGPDAAYITGQTLNVNGGLRMD